MCAVSRKVQLCGFQTFFGLSSVAVNLVGLIDKGECDLFCLNVCHCDDSEHYISLQGIKREQHKLVYPIKAKVMTHVIREILTKTSSKSSLNESMQHHNREHLLYHVQC